MALTRIDAAVRVEKPPVGNSLVDEAVMAMPANERKKAIADRVATEKVMRRVANRHNCSGLCNKPEHTRDAADLPTVLAALGLVPTARRTHKPCTSCGEDMPLSAYRQKGSTPDGLDTRCSPCISASVKKGQS